MFWIWLMKSSIFVMNLLGLWSYNKFMFTLFFLNSKNAAIISLLWIVYKWKLLLNLQKFLSAQKKTYTLCMNIKSEVSQQHLNHYLSIKFWKVLNTSALGEMISKLPLGICSTSFVSLATTVTMWDPRSDLRINSLQVFSLSLNDFGKSGGQNLSKNKIIEKQ